MTAIVGAVVLAVTAGGAALAATAPPGRSAPPGQSTLGQSTPGQSTPDTSVPASGATTASLEVEGGTTRLAVRAANLGGTHGTLLRATTPGGSPGSTPGSTARPARVQVMPARPGKPEAVLLTIGQGGNGSGGDTVTLTLNSAVTWWLDFAGGTQRTDLDLRAGHLAALAFTAGSQVIDAALPRPRGTVPVVMTGGASQLLLRRPAGVPVRLTAEGGAGNVSLDGSAETGVGGGTVFTSPGWSSASTRFDVTAAAGAATISVTR